jgi:hypothetical protein
LVKVKEAFKGYLMTQDHVKESIEEDILNSTGNDYFKFYC